MGERILNGVEGCKHGCGGSGMTAEGPCECIHDQLLIGGSAAFQALADGEIEIRPWDAA